MIGLTQVYAILVGGNEHMASGWYYAIGSTKRTALRRFEKYAQSFRQNTSITCDDLNILDCHVHLHNVVGAL